MCRCKSNFQTKRFKRQNCNGNIPQLNNNLISKKKIQITLILLRNVANFLPNTRNIHARNISNIHQDLADVSFYNGHLSPESQNIRLW